MLSMRTHNTNVRVHRKRQQQSLYILVVKNYRINITRDVKILHLKKMYNSDCIRFWVGCVNLDIKRSIKQELGP